MIVVAHQAVGVTHPVEAFHDLGEGSEERLPVLVIFEYRALAITPRGDMVEGAGELDA